VKRLSYSPFGLGVEDTNEDLRIHVGWHGGLDLQEAGVLIIRQLNFLPLCQDKISRFYQILYTDKKELTS
jgi:hypothetical protein